MIGRLWEWSIVQAESMAETGVVTGLLAAPLLGVVTKEDADSAVVIDMARNILGNPYKDLDDADPPSAPPPSGGVAPDGHSLSDDGGDLGVTGVLQVGGGPVDDLAIGDQKFGRGESSTLEGTSGSAVDESDRRSSAGGSDSSAGTTDGKSTEGRATTGVPSGGVASTSPGGPPGNRLQRLEPRGTVGDRSRRARDSNRPGSEGAGTRVDQGRRDLTSGNRSRRPRRQERPRSRQPSPA